MRRVLAGFALAIAAMVATPASAQKAKSSVFEEPTAAERVRLRDLLDIVSRADRVVALPIVAAGPPMSLANAVGVAFRFYSGARSTQVLICFSCGEMALDGIEGPLGNKKMLDDGDLEAWRGAAQQAFPAEDFRSLP